MLLMNEVKCHKVLNHQNILKIYDQLSSSSRVYMISEYCQKGTLFDFIIRKGIDPAYSGFVSEQIALGFLEQILKAVNHMHSLGIIHRDIKSANVLIQSGDILKLADFGFATFIHNTPTQC